jgi:hypothetical protein
MAGGTAAPTECRCRGCGALLVKGVVVANHNPPILDPAHYLTYQAPL